MSGDTLREHLPEISVPLLECLDGNSVYLNRFDGKIFDQHRMLLYFNGNLLDSRITNLIPAISLENSIQSPAFAGCSPIRTPFYTVGV